MSSIEQHARVVTIRIPECDIETVLLSEDLNVVDSDDKYQCVELLKIIGCKEENNACSWFVACPSSTDKRPHGLIAVYEPACGQFLHLACVT